MFLHIMSHPPHLQKNKKTYDCRKICSSFHLDNEGTEDDAAEDQVVKDALENVPFSVNLASVDLIEKLHHHKGVEDDGVVFRRRGVEGCVPATVDVK